MEGGLEAVRDAANPNIPIVRILDLGVSTDKLAGDAVTGPKLADETVTDDHLVADLAERICPDPSTGSSGQVCARNTAGTAYELVTSSGGGGGGTHVEVDGVVVGYVAGTRTLGVEVEQDNGTDVSGTTVLPLVTATDAGLLPTTGRICPDPTTGTAGQVCAINTAADAYELVDSGGSTTTRTVLLDGVTYTPGAGPQLRFRFGGRAARNILTFMIDGTARRLRDDAVG